MHSSVTPLTVIPPEPLCGDHHTTVMHRSVQIDLATSRNPAAWQRCSAFLAGRTVARKAAIAKGKYQESSYQQHPALYIGLRCNLAASSGSLSRPRQIAMALVPCRKYALDAAGCCATPVDKMRMEPHRQCAGTGTN